jgi:cytochrome b subunit of formate dehydrogenase
VNPNEKNRVVRFTAIQRLFHGLLIVSFLIQGSTGLARMYIETEWGKGLAWVFGGYEGSLAVHKYVGILLISGFVVHLMYLLFKVNWRKFPGALFEPDSLVPQVRDIKEFFQHIGWFMGIGKAPRFDRWGYWEKFDYWAVFWGIPILGATGLILAYSLASSRIMPGWFLNVAFWIHRIEAMLAMVHIFIIHFFIAHLRRHNFPMDRAMFEGSSNLDAICHEKPMWIARLEEREKLEHMLVPEAKPGWRIFYYLFGYAALVLGTFLLIGGLVNSPDITW